MSKLLAQAVDFGTGLVPATDSFSQGVNDSTTNVGVVRNVELFLSNVIGFLTVLASVFFVIYFIIGGFEWVTAGGDSAKVQKARDRMVNGVIGLIVIVASYGIIGLIGTLVGLDLLRPGQVILDQLVPGGGTGS